MGSPGRLTIGLVAPPWVDVPPSDYGGTELIIDELARGLSAAGHDVLLFTTGDSTCPVPKRWYHPAALGTVPPLGSDVAHAEAAYGALAACDVVHDHTLVGPLVALASEFVHIPVVTTAHGRFTDEMTQHFSLIAPRSAIIAISHAQRAFIPDLPATVIHHGIHPDSIPQGLGEGNFALFLGRMSADKGVHLAIDAAREAGIPLRIAAKMWEPDEVEYYEKQVEPRLGGDVTYIGAATHAQKARLLGRARVLINPICWPEPFGLVMIEALAAGTPVVAFANGSAPEIIDHGTTGFLCSKPRELGSRVARAVELDRDACRRAATERFSAQRMVEDHVDVYRSLLGMGHSGTPTLVRPRQR